MSRQSSCQVALALLVAATLVACSPVGQQPAPAADAAPTPGRQQASNDVLSKYSLEQLRQVVDDRSAKSSVADEPAELQAVATPTIVDAIIFRQKGIYGTDRRRDYFEVQNPEMLKAVASVGALVRPANLAATSTGYRLVTKTLQQQMGVCSDQAYATQPTAAYCTAFVVGPDLVATAGHCVQDGWKSTRMVFGYWVTQADGQSEPRTEFDAPDVYNFVERLAFKYERAGEDYALLRVDRPFNGRPALPLQLERKGSAKDSEVYVAGHPSGLPLKVADQAFVRAETERYFTANLDTFGGNSGSPVFDASSNRVLGILVRGDTDYVPRGPCKVAYVCPETGCDGEDVTWIGALSANLGAEPKAAIAPLPAIVRTFSSGPKLSGTGAAFSGPYELRSDPPPVGYRIGDVKYSLSGDRICGNWSTCDMRIDVDRAVLTFRLQGHDEWLPPGQAQSEGHLVVTYVPVQP